MRSSTLLFLFVSVGLLCGGSYVRCNDTETCLAVMRERIGSLKRPVPPGFRRVMKYRTCKVILTPRGPDTLISTSDMMITADGMRLVTEGLEVATDRKTRVVVFPGRKIISIADADTTKDAVGERMQSMGFLQDSLFNLSHHTICRDTVLEDGRTGRLISLQFKDHEGGLFTCRELTLCIDSTATPRSIAIAYRPGASYLSVDIEFLSIEERALEKNEVADVEAIYFLSRREIRPEFTEYSVVDQRKRLSSSAR